jgi:hypothetical protein
LSRFKIVGSDFIVLDSIDPHGSWSRCGGARVPHVRGPGMEGLLLADDFLLCDLPGASGVALYFFQKYLLVGMTFGTVRGEV